MKYKEGLLKLYTPQEIKALDLKRVPEHIAIIPDGNRRWAKRFFFSPEKGHDEGTRVVTMIVNAARLLGIKTLTIYSFSTENWQRSKTEIKMLMKLLKRWMKEQQPDLVRDSIRINTIGDLSGLPDDVLQVVEETKSVTAKGKELDVVLALNYGSRDEIRRAIHSIIDDYSSKRIRKEDLTIKAIASYLDTARWKDPDLLIRTSGEQRISNFLLWQLSYAEIHTVPVLWPEFTPQHFLSAILDYQRRERRGGE